MAVAPVQPQSMSQLQRHPGPSGLAEVLDVKEDKVTGVRVKNLKTDSERIIDCAGVFVAIGHTPNTQIFRDLAACMGWTTA